MTTNLGELLEKTLPPLGFELVDWEMSPKGRYMRVFIDKPKGVSVDDCARVSRHLTRLFAVANVDFDRLEVSSPGLARPLKKEADFVRYARQEAQIRLRLAVNGQRNFTGRLAGVEAGRLRLECDGATHVFELDQVDKARLVPNLKF